MPNNVFRIPEQEAQPGCQGACVQRFWLDVRNWTVIQVNGPDTATPPGLPWKLTLPVLSLFFATEAEAVAAGELWADRAERSEYHIGQ